MKGKIFTASLAAAMLMESVCSATMFTVKFSNDNLKIGDSEEIVISSQFDYYPIKYTIDGSEPSQNGMEYFSPLLLENGVYKLKAGVFTDDGESISDTYERVFVKGIKSGAIQADRSNIIYEEYTDSNNRYPYYAFDGHAEYSNISTAWTVKNTNVTVKYPSPVRANTLAITVRTEEAVDSMPTGENRENVVSNSDVSISLDVKYKNYNGETVSATNGTKKLEKKKGSQLTYTKTYNKGALWTTFVCDIDAINSDELEFDIKSSSRIMSIKEIELFNANAKTYTVNYSCVDSKPDAGTEVELTANTENGEYIAYTLDRTTPDSNASVYDGTPIVLEDGVTTIKSAVFDENGMCMSDVFTRTYIVGDRTNVAVQTDEEKLNYRKEINWVNNRTPKYAFDGVAGFENFALVYSFYDQSDTARNWVEVSYDSPITADTVVIPCRLTAASTNADELKTAQDVSMVLDISYGEDFSEVQRISFNVPKGTPIVYSANAYWLNLPAADMQEFTADKVKFTIVSGSGIMAMKEIELYSSK